MFTGIITDLGKIVEIKNTDSVYYKIAVNSSFTKDLKLGDSISIDGTCLTVINFGQDFFELQLIPETVAKTAFKYKQIGSTVNLEKALKIGDKLDGHLVQGHIDEVAKVIHFTHNQDNWVLEVEIPENYRKFIAYKGSICLNGVSLTVSKKTPTGLEVSLIKHTIENTNLGDLKTGDILNFEVDVIARYVENMIIK